MGIVLLREGVLGEPAARGGVVAPGAEVIDIEALGVVPLLALELQRLEARGRGVLRDGAAQRVVVVVLLGRPACAGNDADGAQVVREEVVIGVVRQGHVSAVEQQARARAVLQHQVSGVIRRGRCTGCRPCLAELRSIRGIAVVDHRPAAEGHGLGQAQDVPGDGRDALAGVGGYASGSIVAVAIRVIGSVGETEIRAVCRRPRVLDGCHLVAAVGVGEVVDQAVGRSRRAAVALQLLDVAVAVIGGDVLCEVDRCSGGIAEGRRGQAPDRVIPEGVGLGLGGAVVLPDHLCAILSPVQRETNV